jgi:CDP-glucose 4,6-dehydratase
VEERRRAVESLGVTLLREGYQGCRALVTGHTGFKGSWLMLMLESLGAKATGLSVDIPTDPNHWQLLKLDGPEHRVDIRDAAAVERAIMETKPDIVFHLAAQSLVRRSYREPLLTWQTNVMGTAHVLEACRKVSSVRAVVVATTDKCYENDETGRPYKETDKLGGHDAYSASKAGAELVAASYREAFYSAPDSPLLATVRAGNVIGGGDWSEDRLIPDLVRTRAKSEALVVRSPNAVRPWQHVLDVLTGYAQLGSTLLAGKKEFAEAWNFGPDEGSACTVGEVLEKLQACWPKMEWQVTGEKQPHEATLLHLDSAKARDKLGWRPRLTLDAGLKATARWYQAFYDNGTIASREQLKHYLDSL